MNQIGRTYRTEAEQFELPIERVEPRVPLNEWDIIGELRARLRKAQGAQFKAEANLAIAIEEKNKLAARLKELGGQLYRLWRSADGPNAVSRR